MRTDNFPDAGEQADVAKSHGDGNRRWWVVAAIAVVFGAGVGVSITKFVVASQAVHATSNQIFTSTGGTFNTSSGQPAFSWSLPNLRDPSNHISLAQFQGHPVILNFWASWCVPCREEMPALEKVALRFEGRITFVGIDTNDQRGPALAFLAKTGVTYPVGYDPQVTAASSYGVYGLPTTFFISPSGKLVGRQIGALTAARLEQLITKVFGVR